MHYIPYQGVAYEAGFRDGLRLLLIGDSFHGVADTPTVPRTVIEANMADGKHRFFDLLHRLVVGGMPADGAARRAFWERVAFTNLVQEPMATAMTPPTRAQWAVGWSVFPAIVAQCRPDVIFFFSRRAWDCEGRFPSPFVRTALPDLRPGVAGKGEAVLRDFSAVAPGYRALSGCFDHPSYVRRTGLWAEWHGWAEQLLGAAPGLLRSS